MFGSDPRLDVGSPKAGVARSMAKQKQSAGPPMTLGNMRELGVQRLIANCPSIKPDW
jgi:hypothetical protein